MNLKHRTYVSAKMGVCAYAQLVSFRPSLEKGWKQVDHLSGYKCCYELELPCLFEGG